MAAVASNIHRCLTAATLLDSLSPILSYRYFSPEYFYQKRTGDARTFSDFRMRRKLTHQFWLTTGKQLNASGLQDHFHFDKDVNFLIIWRIHKRETVDGSHALMNFRIMIHKTGNAGLNSAVACSIGNLEKIVKIMMSCLTVKLVEANRIKPPINAPFIISAT
jgi:hypothetical protein